MLSRIDDEIFEHFSSAFPEILEAPYTKLVTLDEDWMKSEGGKKRWREFMMQWASSLYFVMA
jgi:PBDC1 protein